jgi:hypothetical protein
MKMLQRQLLCAVAKKKLGLETSFLPAKWRNARNSLLRGGYVRRVMGPFNWERVVMTSKGWEALGR